MIFFTKKFWGLSLGILLTAYGYGLATVLSTHLPYSPAWTLIHLLVPPIGLSLGIILGGWLADWLGRKRLLLITPFGYLVGALLIALTSHRIIQLTGCGLLLLIAGTESITIMSFAQESFPAKHRKPAFYAMMNFSNLGGLFLGLITLLSECLSFPHTSILLAVFPIVLSLLLLWLRAPLKESEAWRTSYASHSDITGRLWLRFVIAGIFSLSNTTGFSLLAYAVGSRLSHHDFTVFFLEITAAAFATGLWGPVAARIPATTLLVIAYSVTPLLTAILSFISAYSSIFQILVMILSVAISLTFMAENDFKSRAWPNRLRARMTAGTRLIGQVGYIVALIVTRIWTPPALIRFTSVLWLLSWLGVITWKQIYGSNRSC